MAFPLIPVAIGTAVAIALGYGLMKSTGAKAPVVPSPDAAKKARDAALVTAYNDGKKEGTVDGTADVGGPVNQRPVLNYSTDAALQTQYEHGYNDGYEANWHGTTTVTDTTVKPGGKPDKTTPYDYGCERGTSSGYSDATEGYANSADDRLKTPGSIKRQNESGDPARYREGYRKCYLSAYIGATVGTSMGDEIKKAAGKMGGFESGDSGGTAIVSGPRVGQGMARGSWGPRNQILAHVAHGGLRPRSTRNWTM
jgi:hypothetical protein